MITVIPGFISKDEADRYTTKTRDWVRSHVSWRSSKKGTFESGLNLEIKNAWVAGRSDDEDKALWSRILETVRSTTKADHLDGISGFFTRYEVGNHFAWHSDFDYPLSREWAAILQLSDRKEYDGGEFQFKDHGTMLLAPGDLLLFPATDDYIHRVTKISRGCRKTLVLWAFRDENIKPEAKAPPKVREKFALLRAQYHVDTKAPEAPGKAGRE